MDEREVATLYVAAVGVRKADFYVPYFLRADERGYAPKSWNWAAFFLGIFWFLYRRQFRWAAIMMLAAFLASLLRMQIDIAGFPTLGGYVQAAIAIAINFIYLPLNANRFYYQWVKRRVEVVKAGLPLDRSRQAAVLARLRPNIHLPLMVFAAMLVLAMLTLMNPPTP